MDKKFVKLICINSDECVIYEDYSGRGMYGETTTGIVTSSISEFIKSCIAATLDEPEVMEKILSKNIRSDSMGLDIIFY
jgi:hypothetical protein